MNSAQKLIKNLAIAFGIFLSVCIISSILFVVLMIGTAITGINLYYNSKDLVEETVHITKTVENMNIELQVSKFTIETGPEFLIETKGVKDSFNIDVKNNTLTIKETKKYSIFMRNSEVTIYIPENIVFNEVKIDVGVGETEIEKIVAEKVTINAGVGSTNIEELISAKTTKITGGVGQFAIQSGEINDLVFDSGVGEGIIRAKITGKSSIESGVGKVRLDINEKDTEYAIRTNVGIGAIILNGKKCSNDETYGDGKNIIKINGGIGEVEITTK